MGSTAALPFSYDSTGRHWSLHNMQSLLSFKGNPNPYGITNQQDTFKGRGHFLPRPLDVGRNRRLMLSIYSSLKDDMEHFTIFHYG